MSRGVVAIPITGGKEILMVPHVPEPDKKSELVVGSGLGMAEVADDHYEFPAGATEKGESDEWGIIREIWEETGMLAMFCQLEDANFGIRVNQNRGSSFKEFGVNVVWFQLSELQEKYLRVVRGAVNINSIGDSSIRPRDRAIKAIVGDNRE